MSKYKLLVFDLDDTLLGKEKIIDKDVLATIQRMKQNGYVISSISGRNVSMMDLYNKQMGIDSFAACNGSLIYINNNLIYTSAIGKVDIEKLYLLCHKYDLQFCTFGIYDGYYCRRVPCLGNAQNYNRLSKDCARGIDIKHDDDYVGSDIYKFMTYIDNEKCSRDVFYGEMSNFNNLHTTTAGGYYETTTLTASKGFALERISKELNIRQNEVVYFGDSQSDMTALEYADYKVCMATSPKELKEIANDVAQDYRDINRILLNIEKGQI